MIVLVSIIMCYKNEVDMENNLSEYRLGLEEIRSCIVILQKAVENEGDEILPSDISNYLEIALDKMDVLLQNFDNIETAEKN